MIVVSAISSSRISIHSLVKRETSYMWFDRKEDAISIHSLVKRETDTV